jgi:hypothetical protein
MASVIICSERVLVYDVRNIDRVQAMKVIGFLDFPLAIQYPRYTYEFLTVTHCSLSLLPQYFLRVTIQTVAVIVS